MAGNPFRISLWRSFFTLLFCSALLSAHAQTAGFTATIGGNTFTVKDGDVLRVCKGGDILYKSTASGFSTLAWRYDNGSVGTTNAGIFSVNYPNTGNNFYTVQIVTGTATDSLKVKVIVTDKDPKLKADFTYTPNTVECGSSLFTFDAGTSGGTGLNYNWTFGDGTTATGKKVTHSFKKAVGTAGTKSFTVSLTVTNADGCTDITAQTVTVKNIPDTHLVNDPSNADTTSFGGFLTFCKSETLVNYIFTFINAASTAPNASDTIDWGDGTPKVSFNNWAPNAQVTHQYDPGNHILTRTAVGTNGCINTEQFNVFLGKNSGSSFGTVDNVTDYCVGETKLFKITPGPDNPPGTQYILHVNDCSQDSVYLDLKAGVEYIVSHTFLTPQCENTCSFVPTYTAELFTVNPCKTTELTYPNLNVWGKPKARIDADTVGCVNSTIRFTNISDFGSVYQSGLCLNGGIQVWTVSPATGITYNASQAGSLGTDPGDWKKWTNGSGVLDITFNTPGIYFITLHVSNKKCGVDSITKKICIQDKPKAIFKLTALDPGNCLSDTITLQNNTLNGACFNNLYQWSITASDPSSCSDGSLPVYITGNSTSISPDVWFKQPGVYQVLLKASASSTCYDTTSQKLTIKGLPKVSLNPISDICVNNSINPTAKDVTDCYSGAALTYNWAFTNGNPSSSTSLNPGSVLYTATGPQTVKFSVTNSCGTTTASTNFNVTAKPVANAGNDAVLCSGDSKIIGINTGSYTYSWSPSTGLNNPNIAQPTVTLINNNNKNDTIVYTVKVSAGLNCEDTDTVRVIVKKAPLVVADPVSTQVCKGGSATLTASGADTYTWSPATYLNIATGNTVISTPATTTIYTVTGTLVNGCADNQQVQVIVNAAAVAEAGPSQITCSGMAVQIGTNTGSFAYSWSPVIGLNNPGIATPILTPLYAKDTTLTYYVTVSAGATCQAMDSVKIDVKRSPNVSANPGTAQLCAGESITVTAKGADSYLWLPATGLNTNTGNTVIATPAVTTLYTVTGTLLNGCSNDQPVNITVNAAAAAEAGANQSVCSGSAVSIGTNTGSFTYSWSPVTWLSNPNSAITTVTPVYPSDTTVTYYLTAFAGATCSAVDSVRVDIKHSPVVTINPLNPQVCDGDSIVIKAKGAETYSWSPPIYLNTVSGDMVISTPAVTTAYTVNGSIANGCSTGNNFMVTVKPNAIAAFTPDSYESCAPYNLKDIIKVSSYPTENSKYTWFIKDASGTSTQSFSSALPPDYILKNAGDSVFIYLVATSRSGCYDDTTATVIFKAGKGIISKFLKSNSGLCEPDTVLFTNTSSILDKSVNFTWNFGNDSISSSIQPPAQIYSSLQTYRDTTYYITLKASNTCSSSQFKDSIKIKAAPLARFGVDSTFGCSPLVLTFKNTSLGNNFRYYWNIDDDTVFTTASAAPFTYTFNSTILDTFTVKLAATNGCGTDTLPLDIVVAPNVIVPKVNIFGNDLFGCAPHMVTFNNSTKNALTASWNFGDGSGIDLPGNQVVVTHTYNLPGIYTVNVNFNNGCSKASQQELVTVYEPPQAAFSVLPVPNNVTCFGDSVHLDITEQTGEFNKLIWGDEGDLFYAPPQTAHLYNSNGIFTIKLIADRNNDVGTVCSDTAVQVVKIGARPITTKAYADSAVNCFNKSSQLHAGGGVSYIWEPDTYLTPGNRIANPFASPPATTMYYVSIYGSSGCVVSDSARVIVDYSQSSNAIKLPSAFTPNNDGLNDCFGFNGRGLLGFLDFSVYDRLGLLLFHTSNIGECWDGTYNGRAQAPGTYVYMVRLTSPCSGNENMIIKQKGTVVLIR